MFKISDICYHRQSLALLAFCLLLAGGAFAQSPDFTYQGRLTDNSLPANGNYDFEFKLFDALSGGTQQGATNTRANVQVINGIFSVTLNFGAGGFPGANRWLDISARTSGGGAYSPLTPRQPLTAAPYAIRSLNATSADGLSVACVNCVTSGQLAPTAAVKSLNTLTDSVTLAAGTNVTITPAGNTLTIAAPNALSGVTTDATLTGNGTSGNPLGVAVPLSLSGSSANPIESLTQTGTGEGLSVAVNNAANTSSVANLSSNGTGGGVTISLTNAFSGARGLDVLQAGVGTGVFATSAGGSAVWGVASSISAAGAIGDNTFGEAVVGRNRGGSGVGAVVGKNTSKAGDIGILTCCGYGVRGFVTGDGIGVFGQAGISAGLGTGGRFENVNSANGSNALEAATIGSGYALSAVSAFSGAKKAGNFVGNVDIAGTLTKSGGSFKIDHPLDPANKYLSHSFVESPDMMNIYNGNITTDENGEAVVSLPDYFEALNRDFRYQLTVIGAFAQAIVAEEVKYNHFTIKTSLPRVKVSWQVTGVRQDAWANEHRIPNEEFKGKDERGYYLHPELYRQPIERSVEATRNPRFLKFEGSSKEDGNQPASKAAKPVLASDQPSGAVKN